MICCFLKMAEYTILCQADPDIIFTYIKYLAKIYNINNIRVKNVPLEQIHFSYYNLI